MPKPNYRFEKRQRELARAKKQEEKRLKKEARKIEEAGDATSSPPPATPDSPKP